MGETSLTAVIERTERQRAEWRRGFRYQFYLFEEKGGPVVGGVSLSEIQRGPMLGCNLGYWIDSDHQGKGLIREALHGVLSFGFDVVGLHRVQAAIMPLNRRSLAVVAALGFRLEGLALRYLCVRGEWEDHQIFAMTREEWTESPQPPP